MAEPPATPPFPDVTGLDRATYSVEPRTELLCRPTAGVALARQRFGHREGEATEIEVRSLDRHVVAVVTETTGQPYEVVLAGQRSFRRSMPGTTLLLPAGLDSRWIKRDLACRTLLLHLDPGWLARLAAEEGLDAQAAAPTLRQLDFDPVLSGLADALEAERALGPLSQGFVEHWAALVALRLLQAPASPPRRSYALPPRRLAAVAEFVEANLARDIGLAEMAAVASLSRFHFARAFKRETGLSPHAFLNARRARLAKRLLEDDSLDLAAIAEACGFGSPAQLTEAFRRLTGVTPTQWRRARGE